MNDIDLRADCARCSALCCVSLAFDHSEQFGFDKPAGTPCPHLTETQRCGIHAELELRGFAGCARYDCLGAGQRVTHLFAGASWRDHPTQATAMFHAFRALRHVHELRLLLQTAARLPLSAAEEQRRAELSRQLQPTRGWSAQDLARFERGALPAEVVTFLRSLRHVARSRAGRRRLPLFGGIPSLE